MEPYVGGGGVALHLLFEEVVNRIVINDKDRSLFAFWYSVLNNSEQLCRMIHDIPVNIENWYIQKEIQNNKDNADLLSLGFSTFFLNKFLANRKNLLPLV